MAVVKSVDGTVLDTVWRVVDDNPYAPKVQLREYIRARNCCNELLPGETFQLRAGSSCDRRGDKRWE